jgi:hypothetical protein
LWGLQSPDAREAMHSAPRIEWLVYSGGGVRSEAPSDVIDFG